MKKSYHGNFQAFPSRRKRVLRFLNSMRGRLILSLIVILCVYIFLSTWYWSSPEATRSLEPLALSTYHPHFYDKMLAIDFLASRPNLMWKIDYLPAILGISCSMIVSMIFLGNLTLLSPGEAALLREGNLARLLRYRMGRVNHLAAFCRTCPALDVYTLEEEIGCLF